MFPDSILTEQEPKLLASSKTGHNRQESVNILNTMSISDTKALPPRSAPLRSSKRKHQEAQDASCPTATKQQSTEPTRKIGQLVRPTKYLEGKRNRINKSLSASTTVFEIDPISSDGERELTHEVKKNQNDQDETEEYQDDQDEAEEDQDEHDENQEQEIELYGQESAWSIVWIAARTLGRSDGDDTQAKKLPTLSTDAVQHLIKIAKELEIEFRNLNAKPEAVKSIKKQVSDNIAAIDEEINHIHKMIQGKKLSAKAKMELIIDLYAHAIPNLVFVLRCALCCTSMDYSQSEDRKCIKNIITIQDSILHACNIARSLKVKVKPGVGIVGSTSRKILPYLKIVRKAFSDELDFRRNRVEKQLNEVALEESHKKRLEKTQQENEENAKKQKENCINLSQNIDRSIAWFSSNYDFQPSSSPISTPTTDTQWTNDQDLALIVQLQNPQTCLLPGLCLSKSF